MAYFDTPSPIVEQGAEHFEPGSLVLDMGSCDGRNSLYLASLGHLVVAVDIIPEHLLSMKRSARSMGGVAVKNANQVLGSQDSPPFKDGSFDAVISTAALQFSKIDKAEVIGNLQRLTKPGGINVLSAYFGSSNVQMLKNGYTVFSQYELTGLYADAGWEMIYSDETPRPMNIFTSQLTGATTSTIRSMAEVIAQKPGGKTPAKQVVSSTATRPNTYLGHDREYWYKRDPELYEHLIQSGQL